MWVERNDFEITTGDFLYYKHHSNYTESVQAGPFNFNYSVVWEDFMSHYSGTYLDVFHVISSRFFKESLIRIMIYMTIGVMNKWIYIS